MVRAETDKTARDIQARSLEKMGKNSKLKEKQKWSNEKLHLENERKLRGIYFIDPEDKEFKETIKNARKKLETSVALAMPCKIMKKNCGSKVKELCASSLSHDTTIFWRLTTLKSSKLPVEPTSRKLLKFKRLPSASWTVKMTV